MLQSVTECHRVLQSITECYRVSKSITEYNNVLQFSYISRGRPFTRDEYSNYVNSVKLQCFYAQSFISGKNVSLSNAKGRKWLPSKNVTGIPLSTNSGQIYKFFIDKSITTLTFCNFEYE